MTSRWQGLFPPHPFFKGKALGTRLGHGNNYKTNIVHFSFSLVRIQIIVLNQCLSFTGSARVELSPGRIVRQQQRLLA